MGGGLPPLPEPRPPAPMPDEQSPQVIEAKRLAAANAKNRTGRDSTFLSNPSASPSTIAGGDYSRKSLGGY